jgi:CheY-like chemotaxis protein
MLATVGPVGHRAAAAWLQSARDAIDALRTDERFGVPSDVLDDFAQFVDVWSASLRTGEEFLWRGALPVEKVRRVASHWANVAALARDPSTALVPAPREAAPFYAAVVHGVATATELADQDDRFVDLFVDVVPRFTDRGPKPASPSAARVLVVDDTEDIRLLMQIGLRRSGAIDVCGVAGDGQQAVEACDRLNPDAVLLDVSMPVMDGIAALRVIRARHPLVRVVMFSANDDPAIKATALQLGAAAYLLKGQPIDAVARALLG